ncbi:hypothetical protein UPYG_G00269510 [Umbra pygmaea]|uniref:Link domain-containing protein n=1 Tax=Umbra pygmaea TaxID=75934 RepID=A0ABD0WAK9_UMBPY
MARVLLLSFIEITMALYALAFEYNLIKVFPKDRVSGVSMVSYGNGYALNASQAKDMCLFLNDTIATKQQVETAQKHGLETCGYGWIEKQIAVIPRIVPNPRCGKNKIGVLSWIASPNSPFNVFCFKSTEDPSDVTTRKDQETAKLSTTTVLTSAPATTKTVTNRFKATQNLPEVPTSKSSTQVPRLSPTTTSTSHMVQTTSFFSSPPSSVPSPLPTLLPSTALSHCPLTSSRSLQSSVSSSPPLISLISSTTSHLISSPPQNISANISESPVDHQPVSPAQFSVGVISTVLLIISVILLLLAVAYAVWYYKTIRGLVPLKCCHKGHHILMKDCETEMWEHTDSEIDLQEPQQCDGGENGDKELTHDIVIINPGTIMNDLSC